jgi:hypothetical protein
LMLVLALALEWEEEVGRQQLQSHWQVRSRLDRQWHCR